jgi:hypothetical protein
MKKLALLYLIKSSTDDTFRVEKSYCHTNFAKSPFGKVFLFVIALAKVFERV